MSCYRSETRVGSRELSFLSSQVQDKSTSGSEYRNVIKINENEFSTLVKIMSGEAFLNCKRTYFLTPVGIHVNTVMLISIFLAIVTRFRDF